MSASNDFSGCSSKLDLFPMFGFPMLELNLDCISFAWLGER